MRGVAHETRAEIQPRIVLASAVLRPINKLYYILARTNAQYFFMNLSWGRPRRGEGGESDALRRVARVVVDAAPEFIHKRGRAYPPSPSPPAPPPRKCATRRGAAAPRDFEMRARSPEEPFVFREGAGGRQRERGRERTFDHSEVERTISER